MTTVEELEVALGAIAAGEVNVSRVGADTWALDWKLPMAADAPYSSSLEFDQGEDVITGFALRFSPRLFDSLPDERLQQRFEGIIDRAGGLKGALLHSYVRGDAEETGPHVISPGGFSQVDPDAFIAWLGRLLDEYRQTFGHSAEEYAAALRNAGFVDVSVTEAKELQVVDFKIPRVPEGFTDRGFFSSNLLVDPSGKPEKFVLRYPTAEWSTYPRNEVVKGLRAARDVADRERVPTIIRTEDSTASSRPHIDSTGELPSEPDELASFLADLQGAFFEELGAAPSVGDFRDDIQRRLQG